MILHSGDSANEARSADALAFDAPLLLALLLLLLLPLPPFLCMR